MASLQAQSPGRVGHAEIVPLQFGDDDLAFESFHAFEKPARRCTRRHNIADLRSQKTTYSSSIDFGIRQQQKALDYIAQFANVSRPVVPLQLGVGRSGDHPRSPVILPGDHTGEVVRQEWNVLASLPKRGDY